MNWLAEPPPPKKKPPPPPGTPGQPCRLQFLIGGPAESDGVYDENGICSKIPCAVGQGKFGELQRNLTFPLHPEKGIQPTRCHALSLFGGGVAGPENPDPAGQPCSFYSPRLNRTLVGTVTADYYCQFSSTDAAAFDESPPDTAAQQPNDKSNWPWLVGGGLVGAALLFVLIREASRK
jgi:hypothetical protein